MSAGFIKLDSISPIIQYSTSDNSVWSTNPGNISKSDTSTGQVFHATSSTAASFQFPFYGTLCTS